MEKNFIAIIYVVFSAMICSAVKEDTRCPQNWTSYKDEKCIIVVSEGLQTHEEADATCQAFANDSSRQTNPRLLTIKSYEEQEFVHNLLFVNDKLIDHVWLGLKESWKAGVFEWNDGSDILYTNWVEQNVTDDHHACAQMESGEANDPAGIWVRVNCQKRNTVVCEQMQNWNFGRLQSAFLNLKLQLRNAIDEHRKTVKELKELKETTTKQMEILKNNSVMPVGFIYVQLFGQAAPSTLWPNTTWKDVSSSYAGLFFRVLGDNGTEFGTIQNGSSPHLKNVEWRQGIVSSSSQAEVAIPSDGSWSNFVYTGTTYSSNYNGVKYQLSNEEVRPRNQAVKIWVRIQ